MSIAHHIRNALQHASMIRRVADEGIKMRQDGQGPVFDLSLGNPLIEPPPAFYESMKQLLARGKTGLHRYMPNNGYPETRAAIAAWLRTDLDLPFTGQHVFLSVGAAGGINTLFKALLGPSEEVIFFAPYFVEYGFYTSNHGGLPVIVETNDEFQIDAESLRKAVTEKTRIVMINTPNNPTGVVYTAESLRNISEVLRDASARYGRPIYLLNDTPYRRMVYDEYVDAQAPDPMHFYEHTIIATSFSKDLAIPGERIGYVAFSPQIEDIQEIDEAMAFCARILGFVNAPAWMQHLLPSLLDTQVDMSWYAKKRQRLLSFLRLTGYTCTTPKGAFYIYPKAPGGDDMAFYQELKRHRVLVVPGSGFGRAGYFRIAYCMNDETIDGALPAFAKAYETLHKPE